MNMTKNCVFFDTNVFVYALGNDFDFHDKALDTIQNALDNNLTICTNATVLEEILHILNKIFIHHTSQERKQILKNSIEMIFSLEKIQILQNTTERELFYDVIDLMSKYSIGSNDCVILHTCTAYGIQTIATFDAKLQKAAHAEGLEIFGK